MHNEFKTIDSAALDRLTQIAAANSRLRMNHNFHPEHENQVQRLAIAMEPGTYVRPHRHRQSWELLIPLRGSFGLVVFDEDGQVLARHLLGSANGLHAFEMPAGTWHSVAAREPGSVIFEVKQGSYTPIVAADSAAWAPDESAAAEFIRMVAGN